MNDDVKHRRGPAGPFGMGWQGYLIIAIIVLGSALLAATSGDWPMMLITALVLPLAMVTLVQIVNRFRRNAPQLRDTRRGPMQDADLLAFLARTNPFMFLLAGALGRGMDDDRYRDLLGSGPYGMGKNGYVLALIIVLGPLILTLIIVTVTGQLPPHHSPRLP